MAVRSSIEVERTFELPPDAALPDLVGTAGVLQVRQLAGETLDATYYDTEDLRLSRSRVTLRRRSGGRDAGWHLKLPLAGKGRQELAVPLGRTTVVPRELHSLVRSRARAASLQPVARIRTRRAVSVLIDKDDRVLAEVADDQVSGDVLLGAARSTTWREVEIELVTGDDGFLETITAALVLAGARVSHQQSKLLRTLGDRVPEPSGLGRSGTVAETALGRLRQQVDELVLQEPAARRDEPDAVHKMRVATRRLRSALTTYRPLLERAQSDPLRRELRHLGSVLGGARDAEVLRDRLIVAAKGLPIEAGGNRVLELIEQTQSRQHEQAHAALLTQLDGPRHLALLESLEVLVTNPAWTSRAEKAASREVPRLSKRAAHAVTLAARAAAAAGSPDEREERLHEVRKAAKQARYAAEAAIPVVGKPAAAFALRAARLQTVLGEQQDSVGARERLLDLAAQLEAGGESSFALGALYAQELNNAQVARAAYPRALRALATKKACRWLH